MLLKVMNKVLASGLDMKQLAEGLDAELTRLLRVDWTSVILIGQNGGPFRFIRSECPIADGAVGEVTALSEKARDTGLPIILSTDPEGDMFQPGTKSVLFFPLVHGEEVTAILHLESRQADFFSDRHRSILGHLSAGLAISIRHALHQESLRRKIDELSILYKMARISTSSLGLDQMLAEIVSSLNSFFKFETWSIFLVDETTKRLTPHPCSVGLSEEEMEGPAPLVGKGVPERVAENGEPLLLNDLGKDSTPLQTDGGSGAEMCVPLKSGEKVVGIIDARSKKPNAFSENDFHLFKIVGEHLSNLIENIRSEERYRAVVEGALDGVMVLSEDDRVTYVNDRLAEMLGYSKDELSGMDFRACLDEESKRAAADLKSKRPRGAPDTSRIEFNVLRKDRKIRNVEASSTMIKDSHGNTSVVVFVKDITEKKRMEQRFLQSEKLRAMGELAGGVAHDFNTALAVILGNTQLLLSMTQEEEARNALKAIENEAQESAETVRRLLEFTRKGGYEALGQIDLNHVIKEAVEATKHRWKDETRDKGVHIGMILNLEEIPPVAGIASDLKEVMTHLIINAVEAMPCGGRIDIRTFEREGVCVQISDTGVGMTEEVKKKLFEPFFTTQPFTHTGLGLSMSYGIVRRLGGSIEVESRTGEGCLFTITLSSTIDGNGDKNGLWSCEARILLIEEKEIERYHLSKILEQGRHQVVTAENGKKGIHLFHEREFDIVLTNLNMPDMSGWDVCRTIKMMNPRTPIGMITGVETKIDRTDIENNKIDFLISPPFDMNQILSKVAQTMEYKGLNHYA